MRLAGQDTRRGTFSQRHGVLVDQRQRARVRAARAPRRRPGAVHALRHRALGVRRARLRVRLLDRVRRARSCWEAQFGDFANVAQVIIDQFIVAAADKWGQRSSLALLLPHGFEGQGPEHSSARIERYLTLCAEDNLRVVYPIDSGAVLPRAAAPGASPRERVPLVCFTPKRYLRMPQTRSPVAAFTDGAFHVVLDDPRDALDAGTVTRVVLCTGKIGHELMDERDAQDAPVAIVRVEQLYPWPEAELVAVLDRYPAATLGVVGAGGAVEHGRVDVRRTSGSAPSRDERTVRRGRARRQRQPRDRQRQDPRPRAAAAPRRRLADLEPTCVGRPVEVLRTNRVGSGAEGAEDGVDDARRRTCRRAGDR